MTKNAFEIAAGLKAAGFSSEGGEVIVSARYEVQNTQPAQLATKTDLAEIRIELAKMRAEILIEIVQTRETLRIELGNMKTSIIMCSIGTVIAVAGLVFAAIKLVR